LRRKTFQLVSSELGRMSIASRAPDATAAPQTSQSPTNKTLQVWCEAYVAHYWGVVERCLILGDAAAAVHRACAVALEAYEAAAELVRPGVTFDKSA
jgi:hypothetical protein